MNREQLVQDRIRCAREIYMRHGDSIMADAHIRKLLRAYKTAIDGTNRLFITTGVVEACSECASKSHGSCCFAGMEENYELVLLLINLLMGCDLPCKADFPEQCLFVGERGCKLYARYSFCVNFFCPRLEKSLGTAEMEEILIAIGDELYKGWELEQALLLWLRDRM